MDMNMRALCYLHAWEEGLPIEGGVALEKHLRAARLDYSLQSLARLDAFLDAVRRQRVMTRESFLQHRSQQNFFYLLGFYVGEVIGRAQGQAPHWQGQEAASRLDSGNGTASAQFEDGLVLTLQDHPSVGSRSFLPLVALVSRAFDEPVEKSVLFSAGIMLPADPQSSPLASDSPGPLPPPRWSMRAQSRMRQGHWQVRQPDWLRQDALAALLDAEPRLFSSGNVVWACVIQANRDLSDRLGALTAAPAEIVYDPRGRAPWGSLYEVAQVLLALRDQSPQDEDAARIAQHLRSETGRLFGQPVPSSVIPYRLCVSSTWIQRWHLFGQSLAQPIIPVVISDDLPGFAMPLPAACWPEEIKELWRPALRAQGVQRDYLPPEELGPERPMSLLAEGTLYLRGGKDFPSSTDKAYAAWRKAADSERNATAWKNLGRMYEAGLGRPADLQRALEHYEEALELGESSAEEDLDRVRQAMKPEQPGFFRRLLGPR